jgi:hypothetical protein
MKHDDGSPGPHWSRYALAHGVVTVQFPREIEESELPDLLAYLDLVKKQIVRCVVRKKEAGEQERDSNAG